MNPNTLYQQEQQTVQAQIPAIQQLYQQVIQGLQQQAQTGVQNVTQSAQQRGVDRPSLATDVQNTLGQEVGMQGAQLNVQQAQDIAGITGNLSNLGMGRVTAVNQLAEALQNRSMVEQQAVLDAQTRDRETAMQIQQIERQAELERIAESRRRSSGGGGGAGSTTSGLDKQDEKFAENLLRQQSGADGNVSPDTYNRVLSLWQEAGGDPIAFHDKFNKYVNKKHSQDYYNYRQFVSRRSGQNIQAPNF